MRIKKKRRIGTGDDKLMLWLWEEMTRELGSTGLRGGNSTRETPVMEIQGRKSSTMREKLTGSDDTERVS